MLFSLTSLSLAITFTLQVHFFRPAGERNGTIIDDYRDEAESAAAKFSVCLSDHFLFNLK